MEYDERQCEATSHGNESCDTATHCNSLELIATHCQLLRLMMGTERQQVIAISPVTLQLTATHCNSLHLIASQCNTLQPAATNVGQCEAKSHGKE